ncbi:MAG: hypothetical protein LKJ17_07090 [Oscillospiraceae bacterium]|jgi:hypothetical protein|nr:hypothetical protein [Oscillospiraceae bacterium]
MVKLLVPFLLGGRMIPSGRTVQLSEEMEERLVAAGNARREPAMENPGFEQLEADKMSTVEKNNLIKRAKSLKLDLPDNLTEQDVKAVVEEAEKKTASTPDLHLGRAGVQSE